MVFELMQIETQYNKKLFKFLYQKNLELLEMTYKRNQKSDAQN